MKTGIQAYRFSKDIGNGGSKEGARWLAKKITPLLPEDADPERVGIYLANSDAAVDISVSFWKSAIAEGVDFVNPRDFQNETEISTAASEFAR